MKKPKGILFDFGDTILHQTEYNPWKANEYLFSILKNKNNVKYEQFIDHIKWIIKNIATQKNEACTEISWISFDKMIIEFFNLELPISYEEAEIEFWNKCEKYSSSPGIKQLLDYLNNKSIPVGIVSNSVYRGLLIENELAKHRLRQYFSFVMSSSDYGLRKPHPFLFKLAASKLGFPPEDIWFFGDNIECDIHGSKFVGMTPFYYTGNVKEPGNAECKIIRHWDEAIEILEKL